MLQRGFVVNAKRFTRGDGAIPAEQRDLPAKQNDLPAEQRDTRGAERFTRGAE